MDIVDACRKRINLANAGTIKQPSALGIYHLIIACWPPVVESTGSVADC
jgi:hypothetical protein